MKKTMKTLLALMAGVMTFSACSNEDVLTNENTTPEAKPILSFTATTESDGATRAAIDGFDIKWQENDAILMMDGTNSSKYNLDAECDGTTSGTFTVDGESTAVSGENIYAIYPYAESSFHTVTQEEAEAAAEGSGYILHYLEDWKEGCEQYPEEMRDMFLEERHVSENLDMEGISEANKAIIYAYIKGEEIGSPAPALSGSSITNVTIPAVQTVAAGQTVDPKAVLMVAKADGENLSFKNVCSYVKVTPTVACKKIEVRAEGANLAGACTVAVSDEPAASNISNGTSVVTLQAQAGNLAADETYYIAVLPGTKSNGIEVRFYTGDDTFNHNVRTTSYEFVRSKVHNGGNNSGAAAVYWSLNTGNDGWADVSASDASTITFSTGVAGSMPDGAKALNNDNTLWSRNDGEGNYFIETPASKIYAKSLDGTFFYAENVTTMTGLDKIDVSESSSFDCCFYVNSSITTLDLSTWKISPNASTENMFGSCTSLTSLTLNNTFHSGYAMFEFTAYNSNCIVYGVTDEAVKNDLMTGGPDPWDSTGWDPAKMQFYGE